jgi:hypothetical protein
MRSFYNLYLIPNIVRIIIHSNMNEMGMAFSTHREYTEYITKFWLNYHKRGEELQ